MTRLIPGRDRPPSGSPQLLGLAEALTVTLRARTTPSVAVAPGESSTSPRDAPRSDIPSLGPRDAVPSPGHPPPADDPCQGPEEPAAALWAAYRATPDRLGRDRLVVHYCPLVRAVVQRTAVRLPAHVDVADLVQSGVFGLVEAIERYDPERSPRFESYAASRIRGAVLDELRAQDWVPRTVRLRARQAAHAREHLTGRLRRTATEREVADLLQVGSRELGAAVPNRVLSFELLREHSDGGALDTVPGDAPDPAAAVQERETRRQLWQAVAQLGERDRLVVRLYYLERRTLADIGRMLGVTESRICQLHARLVGRLRGALEELAAG
jgi:RNA polymerase sigma factor for flagellar operon FliA